MSDCGCHAQARNARDRRILTIALVLNATMAVVGGFAGWRGHSTGLLADALDMLADASAYAIGLAAIGRGARFKSRAALVSGAVLLMLGIGVLLEVVDRVRFGAEPEPWLMLGAASVSLMVNLGVLRMLAPLREGEVHLRATWLFTRVDVIANIAVILAGVLVAALGSPYPDLIIGALIGLYVVKEATEILLEARRAGRDPAGASPARDAE